MRTHTVVRFYVKGGCPTHPEMCVQTSTSVVSVDEGVYPLAQRIGEVYGASYRRSCGEHTNRAPLIRRRSAGENDLRHLHYDSNAADSTCSTSHPAMSIKLK